MAEKFTELKIGTKEKIEALVMSVEEKESKNGPYCVAKLSDGEQVVDAKAWGKSKAELGLKEKVVAEFRINTKEYRGAPDYSFASFGPAKGANVENFVIAAPVGSMEMYGEILNDVHDVTGEDGVYALVKKVFSENMEKLLYWSAAKGCHHNYYGGLLYHTYRMVKAAKRMAEVYENVNPKILMAGTTLHDIGKLVELETDALGSAEYGVDGTLFGHLYLGTEMVRKAAAELKEAGRIVPTDDEVRQIAHCIASHHGEKELGAISVPATPEAMLVHELDMVDSRMEMFEQAYRNAEAGRLSDSSVRPLGTRVYKPED